MSSPSLYNLLKSADLLSYHDQLKTTLKLRNAGDLAYCEEKDFASIGMSRPEQKRLKQECSKHNVPGPSTSTSTSLAYKLKKKVFGGGSEPVANHVSECPSPTDTQHVIAAEDINLCKELGKGEFGCVYQAAWHIENKAEVLQVAVKRVLPEKLVSNPNSFLQEAAIMCKMRHENVIRLYGVVLDTKAVMLVSELAPCGSLLECLQSDPNLSPKSSNWREPFSIPTLCDFCLQIAQGMQYLTSKRLIHRDLAARNVLVASPSKVKISDFGLSRSLGVGEDYYRTDFNPTMKLPIAWCAPECINFLRFTPASDVWAYAVTLWEMFTFGKMPWEGYSGAQILTAIDQQHKKLDWPQACPADFYKIMCECWSHQPEARPTFEDLIQKLAQIMPQQLITITSSTSDHPQLLQFTKGDVIVLINKLPTTCTPLPHTTQTQDEKMWFGALRRTGKLGLFKPEDTVAYLGAENPCASSPGLLASSKQSNGDKAPAAASKKTVSKAANLLGGESDKERKKLLISQPHADLRHTCHIGADGRNFGLLHVNKTEFTRALLTTPNPSNSNTLSINTRPPSVCTLSHTSLSSSTAVSPHPQDPSAPTLPPKRSSFGVLPQQPLTIINHQQVMNKQSLQITALEHIHHQTLPPPRPPKTKAYRKDSNQMTSPSSPMGEMNCGSLSFPLDFNEKSCIKPMKQKESEDSEINGASTLEFANLQRPNSICATSVSCDADTSQEVTFPYSTGDSVFSSASLASSQALDQVLNDLQKDISDFSLSTINDFADTRPLLNQKHHPNQQPRAADGSSDQASQQQQSVVRAMTPEESDKWMKRVEEEHKKAAKTLKRLAKKESGSVEEEFTTVDNTTTDGPSTIVDCGKFTSQLSCRNEEWSPDAMAAYKLLVQCGSFLKNTPNNTLINSTNTSNGRKTDPQQHQELIQDIQPKHHIEYINSKLIGFNQRVNTDTTVDSKKAEYENDSVTSVCTKRAPPAVPPKPKKRTT